MITVYGGDCRDILAGLPENSIDAVVTDPPYNLSEIPNGTGSGFVRNDQARTRRKTGFMGKAWDDDVAFDPEPWRAVLRVLKPGGHMLAFGGTRTHHRLWCAIEDAGFEVRDSLQWIFATGFPKHRNALKPAYEPILLARRPLDGTVAANVLRHGVGGLNIDACRVPTDETITATRNIALGSSSGGVYGAATVPGVYEQHDAGRWPSNIIHDGSGEVLAAFAAYGERASRPGSTKARGESVHCFGKATQSDGPKYDDTGTAARFFYSAKASKADRAGSRHPCVKPISLLEYLITLITPPGGTVLDPFAGSGTTGQAACNLGLDAVLIEREAEYQADIARRFAAK